MYLEKIPDNPFSRQTLAYNGKFRLSKYKWELIPSVRQSVCLSVHQSISLSIHQSICQFIYPSICLPVTNGTNILKIHVRAHSVHKPHHNMVYSIHKPLVQWGGLGGGDAIKFCWGWCNNEAPNFFLEGNQKKTPEGVKYNCTQYDYKATHQTNLKQHQKSIHKGVKYDGNQCHYKATQQAHLRQHQ